MKPASPDATRVLAPNKPHTPVPGSKAIRAKELLREGKSLAEAAAEVGLPKDILDRELWRLLGLRLDASSMGRSA